MRQHLAALLLVADGRFPAGGYAHSGGLEPSVHAGRVCDVEGLRSFLTARAQTVGVASAAFAAAACRAGHERNLRRFEVLDGELDARLPSPAQRSTSRQLGRQLLRAMSVIAPDAMLDDVGDPPHQPLALGAACAAFGLGPDDAALAALHESVAGPTAAAVRLLSVDPFHTHATLAALGPLLDDLAASAAEQSAGPARDLPALATPLLDLDVERHARRQGRLFAS